MSRKSKSASEKEDPTTSTPKTQKDGPGGGDEKGEFTGAEQGPGDDDGVEHDGEVMLIRDDDDGKVLLQPQESHLRQMGELEKQVQRAMDNALEQLEQQWQERAESGPPGLPLLGGTWLRLSLS